MSASLPDRLESVKSPSAKPTSSPPNEQRVPQRGQLRRKPRVDRHPRRPGFDASEPTAHQVDRAGHDAHVHSLARFSALNVTQVALERFEEQRPLNALVGSRFAHRLPLPVCELFVKQS